MHVTSMKWEFATPTKSGTTCASHISISMELGKEVVHMQRWPLQPLLSSPLLLVKVNGAWVRFLIFIFVLLLGAITIWGNCCPSKIRCMPTSMSLVHTGRILMIQLFLRASSSRLVRFCFPMRTQIMIHRGFCHFCLLPWFTIMTGS